MIFFIVHVHFYEAQEKSAKAAQTRSPTAPMHLYTQRYTQWVYIHIRTKILLFYFINIIHTPVQHRSWKWLPFERLVICMYRCTYWWWDDGGFYFYVSLYFILLCVVVVFISLYIVAFCECTILIFFYHVKIHVRHIVVQSTIFMSYWDWKKWHEKSMKIFQRRSLVKCMRIQQGFQWRN